MSSAALLNRIQGLTPDQRARLIQHLDQGAENDAAPNRLALFVRPEPGVDLDPEKLRNGIANRLPEHLVPADIHVEPELPRLPNGKLDHTALKSMARRYLHRGHASRHQGPAIDSLFAEVMREIWSEVLKVSPISDDDDFFELGGDSILSIAVASRAAKRGLNFKTAELFDESTIRGLAKRRAMAAQTTSFDRLPQAGQTALPCVVVIHTTRHFTERLQAGLGDGRDIHTIQIGWDNPYHPTRVTLDQITAGYVAEIDRIAPQGPYYLVGYSNICLVVYEVAQALQRRGDTVAKMFLIDPPVRHKKFPAEELNAPDPSILSPLRETIRDFRSIEGIMKHVRESMGNGFKRLKKLAFYPSLSLVQSVGLPLPVRNRPAFQAAVLNRAYMAHSVEPYDGDTTIFFSVERRPYVETTFWRKLVKGRFEIINFDSGHYDFWYDHVLLAELANHISSTIKDHEAGR